MSKIIKIYGIEILNSRGIPTVEVHLKTEKVYTFSSCPSGKSKSKKEAVDLRDNSNRYFGKGVLKAVNNVNNKISKIVIGRDVNDYAKIEEDILKLDNERKSLLGANAILPTIISILKAYSLENQIPLYKTFLEYYYNLFGIKKKAKFPIPMANLINGGLHSSSNIEFQEFMVVPVKIKDINERIRVIAEIFHHLKKIIIEKYGKGSTNYGDEGGYVIINENENRKIIEILEKAIEDLGYRNEVKVSLDIAASSFYSNGYYKIKGELLTKIKYLEYLEEEIVKPNLDILYSIEDPFYEEDYDLFAYLTSKYKKLVIIGDDLTSTNVKYLKKAIGKINGVIVKPNQIGSIKETLEFLNLAEKNNMKIVVSHRSGETCDVFISHLGFLGDLLKIGAPNRGERVEKYNELLRIYHNVLIN